MTLDLDALAKLCEAHLAEGPPYVKHLYETVSACRALIARLKAQDSLLEVAGRKMRYMVHDYKDDKESRKWLDDYAAYRASETDHD